MLGNRCVMAEVTGRKMNELERREERKGSIVNRRKRKQKMILKEYFKFNIFNDSK